MPFDLDASEVDLHLGLLAVVIEISEYCDRDHQRPKLRGIRSSCSSISAVLSTSN